MLFSEGMLECAQQLLDTSDIVRDGGGTLFPAYVAYPQAFDIAARNPTLRWKYALHSRQFIEESVIFTRTRAMMPASPLTVTRSAARRSFVKADEAQWR